MKTKKRFTAFLKKSMTCFKCFFPVFVLFLALTQGAFAWNGPSLVDAPKTTYEPISSVFPHPADLCTIADPSTASDQLHQIASATPEYHQELSTILEQSGEDSIDAQHLLLLADAIYYPWSSFEETQRILKDPRFCAGLSYSICQAQLKQVRTHAQLALSLSSLVNQILATGIAKAKTLHLEESLELLQKLYPADEDTRNFVESAVHFARLKTLPLNADALLKLMLLGVAKGAQDQSSQLAIEWYTQNSDFSANASVNLLNLISSGDVRDRVLDGTLQFIQSLSVNDAKSLIFASKNRLLFAQRCLEKITDPTGFSTADILEIANLLNSELEKSTWIQAAVRKLKTLSAADAIGLLRLLGSDPNQVGSDLVKLIPTISGNELAQIAQAIPYGTGRDLLILRELSRVSLLLAEDGRLLTSEGGQAGLQIALACLSKIRPLNARDLTQVVSALSYGPDRDTALLQNLAQVSVADLPSARNALHLAYASQLQVLSSLFQKFTSLSSSEVSILGADALTGSLRDEILLEGARWVTQFDLAGMVNMVAYGFLQKEQIALTLLSRTPALSANDLGSTLKPLEDGEARDRVISATLPLLKSVNGSGAAKIVERSLDHKVETAVALVKLIPQVTGTDLDQILAACSAGTTRDLILNQTIPLLGSLNKEEAKSLHRRAYTNKDKVAILLMAKVDNFDGETIAEIALLSAKGASRDLIITEGLKRLKTIDTQGLIAMIGAADKMVELLALQVVSRIANYQVEQALAILEAITSNTLKDKFLIRSVDLILKIDEPAITLLALGAITQKARDEIVRRGIDRLENPK